MSWRNRTASNCLVYAAGGAECNRDEVFIVVVADDDTSVPAAISDLTAHARQAREVQYRVLHEAPDLIKAVDCTPDFAVHGGIPVH
jgi:hypothetical protein